MQGSAFLEVIAPDTFTSFSIVPISAQTNMKRIDFQRQVKVGSGEIWFSENTADMVTTEG